MKFSEQVAFELKELKVFDYPHPILLMGTDLLGLSPKTRFTFSYIGINPSTTVGEIIFYDRVKKEALACELLHAPSTHAVVSPPDAPLSAPSPAVHLSTSRAAQVAALVMDRGQRLQ